MEERRRKQTTEEDKKKKMKTVSRTEPPIIAFVEERQKDNDTKVGPDRCQIYQERKVETNTCQILWLIVMHIVPTIMAIKNTKICTFLKTYSFIFELWTFWIMDEDFPPIWPFWIQYTNCHQLQTWKPYYQFFYWHHLLRFQHQKFLLLQHRHLKNYKYVNQIII